MLYAAAIFQSENHLADLNLLIGYFTPHNSRPPNMFQFSFLREAVLSTQIYKKSHLIVFSILIKEGRTMQDIIDRKNECSANMSGFSATKNTQSHTLLSRI